MAEPDKRQEIRDQINDLYREISIRIDLDKKVFYLVPISKQIEFHFNLAYLKRPHHVFSKFPLFVRINWGHFGISDITFLVPSNNQRIADQVNSVPISNPHFIKFRSAISHLTS